MHQIDFFGAAVFVPIFLVSTGLLLDPSVMFRLETMKFAALFIVACVGGKALGFVLAGAVFKVSRSETVADVRADHTSGGRHPGRDHGRLPDRPVQHDGRERGAGADPGQHHHVDGARAAFVQGVEAPSETEPELGERVVLAVQDAPPSRAATQLATRLARRHGGVVETLLVRHSARGQGRPLADGPARRPRHEGGLRWHRARGGRPFDRARRRARIQRSRRLAGRRRDRSRSERRPLGSRPLGGGGRLDDPGPAGAGQPRSGGDQAGASSPRSTRARSATRPPRSCGAGRGRRRRRRRGVARTRSRLGGRSAPRRPRGDLPSRASSSWSGSRHRRRGRMLAAVPAPTVARWRAEPERPTAVIGPPAGGGRYARSPRT